MELAPKSKGIVMDVAVYRGALDAVRKTNANLTSLNPTVSPRLEMPEVVNPNDVRNDLYVFLVTGSFKQDDKKSAKNIEVCMRVVDNKGQTVPVMPIASFLCSKD